MSTVALKIQRNTAPSPPPYTWVDEDFYEQEVKDSQIFDGRNSIIKILGSGKPKVINRSGYGYVEVTFNLWSTNASADSTLSKLKNIEQFQGDEGRLIIYPKYIDDTDIYRTVILPKGQIPDEVMIAGRNAGLNEITVRFLEIEKQLAEAVLDEGEL